MNVMLYGISLFAAKSFDVFASTVLTLVMLRAIPLVLKTCLAAEGMTESAVLLDAGASSSSSSSSLRSSLFLLLCPDGESPDEEDGCVIWYLCDQAALKARTSYILLFDTRSSVCDAKVQATLIYRISALFNRIPQTGEFPPPVIYNIHVSVVFNTWGYLHEGY